MSAAASDDSARLLETGLLPESLFDPARKRLHLPTALVNAYLEVLSASGLIARAQVPIRDGSPVGGISQKDADEHFALAFGGSVARAQLAVLDPKNEVTRAANAFIETLSGNKICLVDVPCGAGAASLAFLSTIAQLRAEGVLPRMPLDVCLIGGEIGAPARAYAGELIARMIPMLETQAIFLRAHLMHWDVLDDLSNTDLIQKMTEHSIQPARRFLLVANFSGFLERAGRRKEAAPQLDELFRHTSGPGALAAWIEPNMNLATAESGLFAWLRGFLRWLRPSQHQSALMTTESHFRTPFGGTATARLAVARFDLER